MLIPISFSDPDFGVVYFEYGRWSASHNGTGVPILFYCGQQGIDQRLRTEAIVAIRKVALLEQRGREYLAATQPNWFVLKLSSLSVFYPESEWSHEKDFRHDGPIVSLEFTIPGDQNVVDVVFLGDNPVDLDYH
ncbi:MAG TPA: hypothetical protein VNU44_07750 [Bryobacteraceae bacterium]|jgi:hypothetical protein|nr:hypothetical protein [Bryobacteraceae bacterium]